MKFACNEWKKKPPVYQFYNPLTQMYDQLGLFQSAY